MNALIATAIRDKRRLSFVYHGRSRVAEPQCYGIGHKGTELLRVHLIEGISREREPLFDVGKMEDLRLLTDTFSRPGPNYKKNDSAMKTIYGQL